MEEKRRENQFLVDTIRLENVSLLRCVSRTKARALVSLRGNKCIFFRILAKVFIMQSAFYTDRDLV